MFINKVLEIIKNIEYLKNNENVAYDNKLPNNVYFLKDDNIVCFERDFGDSRYLYSKDGFSLWAFASGYMYANESTFNSFLYSQEGNEPNIAFFAGLKKEDGNYFPLSLLGVAKQPIEPKDVVRYTIFTPQAVYYVTDTDEICFCVRAFVSNEKEIYFSVAAINKTDKKKEFYLSSYLNPLLRFGKDTGEYIKWWRECKANEYGFIFKITQDLTKDNCVESYGIINRIFSKDPIKKFVTTSRSDYTGAKSNSLNTSTSLIFGEFTKNKKQCSFIDLAISGDINHFTINPKEYIREDYRFCVSHNEQESVKKTNECLSQEKIDRLISQLEAEELKINNNITINFYDFKNNKIKDNTFNNFINYTKRQVLHCALGKTYAGHLLGIRDVFQQLESALMWQPKECRVKILEAIGFIDPSGRAPRQYSIPAKGTAPAMDLREFIDQGVWIISTIYTYLNYTNDFEFLNEKAGYYKIKNQSSNLVEKSEIIDSVLCHMLKIMDYLISNIDEDTSCVKALFGDWNDALDGLGDTKKEGQKYGNGVSVMVTLQFYQNLNEMINLLSHLDNKKYDNIIKKYIQIKDKIKEGLLKHAIATKGESKKIIHGWGDDRSYFIGSFNDVDGKNRDSLVVSAFWIISDMFLEDLSLKEQILEALYRLQGKYGLKTFEPYFAPDVKGVGRIVRLPKGTAENACVYIHGSMFAVSALFKMGKSKLAWEQIEKLIPITHESVSTSPFVMPNSYCHNPEMGIDGESMNDWHTGSATVLIKNIVRYAFGIEPDFNGISIAPAEYMPSKIANIDINIKGSKISLNYKNNSNGTRKIFVNKKEVKGEFLKITKNYKIYLTNKELESKDILVEIFD